MNFNPFDYNSFSKAYGDLLQNRQDDSPPASPTNSNVPAHQEARTDPARLRGRDNSTIYAMPELRDALYGATRQADASGDEGRRIGRSDRIGQSPRMPELSNLRDGMFHSTRHDQVHIQRGDITPSESQTPPPSPPGARRGIMSRIGSGLGKALGLSRGGKAPSAASLQQSVISTEFRIDYAKRDRISAYSEDESLIQDFEIAIRENANKSTIDAKKHFLRRFSDWLKENNKPAMAGRLEEASLDVDARAFMDAMDDTHLKAALNHLREFRARGTADIRTPGLDSQEDAALLRTYQAAARAGGSNPHTLNNHTSAFINFSKWLRANDKPAIATRLHDKSLDDDATEFTDPGSDNLIRPILKHLRRYKPGMGAINIGSRGKVPHDADIEPIGDFRRALAGASSEANAKVYGLALAHFSRWCLDNNKGAIVWRRGDDDLKADIDAFKKQCQNVKAKQYISGAMRKFRQHRQVVEANNALGLQREEQGLGVEGARPAGLANAGPSYQPQAPASHLTSVPSRFSGRDLDSYFDSTASRPQTPASHLTSLPSHFSGRDLDGYFDSTASQAPTPFASTQDGLFEFTNNLFGAPYPYPGSAYTEASPAFDYDLNAPPPPEMEAPGGSGQTHTAPEFVDLDNYQPSQAYQSSQAATVGAAQRLAGNAWLHSDDFVGFTRMIAERLRGQPNAHMLSFAAPQQVYYLARGERAGQVMQHLTAPIVFLPVNNDNSHWSLLVVNQQTRQAFHYDSMVAPNRLHLDFNTRQYDQARRVANTLLGERTSPTPMPIARQRDLHSCGDHVLAGIEELARRAVSGYLWENGGMDLSEIRPNRDHIVDVLTRVERLDA